MDAAAPEPSEAFALVQEVEAHIIFFIQSNVVFLAETKLWIVLQESHVILQTGSSTH